MINVVQARLCILIFTFLFSFRTVAQIPDQYFDTIEVISTRIPQKIHESGRHITVISGEQLQKMPVNSVDELLRYIPGIEIQGRGNFGIQSDIIMRGSTFSQVLVLIDGMRMNDPITAHFNGNIPIAPAEIERIEILHGPAAAMYGADAMGGVIHIISKTFSNSLQEDVMEVGVGVKYGEFNYTGTEAGVFYKKSKLKAGLGIITHQSEGQYLPSGLRTFFDIKTISGSIAIPLGSKLQLMARTGYDYRDFNAQYFYTRSPFDKSVEKLTGIWNQARLTYTGEKSKTWVDAGFKYMEDYFLFNPAFPPANEHTSNLFTLQVNHLRPISSKVTLNAGLQADQRTIRSNDRGDHEDMHAAGYAIVNYKPIEPFSLSFSLRGDYDENYGTEILPQFSTAYNFNKLTLRGAAGRSIRAADFTERFISNNLAGPLPQGRNIGNPNLKAETAWSAEAGADYYPAKQIRFSVTGFIRFGENYIDYIVTPYNEIPNNRNLTPGSTYFYPQNLVDVNTSGIQTEIWLQRDLNSSSKIEFLGGYSFTNVETAEPVQGSKYISSQARHLFNFNLLYSNTFFDISINSLYKKRDEEAAPVIERDLASSFMVWNGKVNINLFKSKLFASFEVLNLFNTQYSDILGAKMPDRWMLLGLKYTGIHSTR